MQPRLNRLHYGAMAVQVPELLAVADQQVEPARRGGMGGNRPAGGLSGPSAAAPQGYAYAAAPQASAREAGFAGGIPSSIIPAHASQARAAATAQKTAAPVTAGADNWQAETPVQGAVGHTAATTYAGAATATARKLDDEASEADTWTRPSTPAQSYNRTVPPVTQSRDAAQPRGVRHGNSFIPPKPVDPRQAAAPSGDMFGGEAGLAAPKAAAAPAEKQVKKSPSLFERFTLQRHKEDVAEAPAEAAPVSGRLTVEEGGKKEEDELDIPAFLRRQAN